MGRIKSALEIALEKTDSVKSDKTSIGLFEAKQQGKRLANQFLAGEITSIDAEIKKAAADEQDSVKQGCFEIFAAQITLPNFPEDLKRLEILGNGLAVLIPDKSFSMIYKQFLEAVSRFLNEAAQYDEAIKKQYAPKLRQKEEELSRRMGRQVKIDPFQDPEFVAFYNQHAGVLRENYQSIADEVRNQARELFRL